MNVVAVDPGLHQLLYCAIENKQLIRFRYHNKERFAEPHDYGVQKRVARLLSWQMGGQSSGRIPGWRWFDVIEMQDCEMLDEHFPGNRNVPTGKHHQWEEVFIRVTPSEQSKMRKTG